MCCRSQQTMSSKNNVGVLLLEDLTMISAYEHGQNAARHGKHIQACRSTRAPRNGANGARGTWLIAPDKGSGWNRRSIADRTEVATVLLLEA